MRASTCGAALLFFGTLLVGPIIGSFSQGIDEWEALDRSLRTAKSIHPKNGFVPDESTAVKIGEAAAAAQYGEVRISQERPFRARLRGDVWTVQGTLHPQGAYGGTAVIKLSKTDGRILFMVHQE
jgi:NTF2 fold immunity protein